LLGWGSPGDRTRTAAVKLNGGEGGICSQSDVLDPASCRNEYATVARNATVATPHCPLLPADHLLLTLCPLGSARNRQPVLRLRQASSNFLCRLCPGVSGYGLSRNFFRGAERTNLHIALGQAQGSYGASEDLSLGWRHSICLTTLSSHGNGDGAWEAFPSRQGLWEEVGGLSWRKF
jgi:hypothetical protein